MNQEKCRAAIEDIKTRAARREDALLSDLALLLEELIWPSEEPEAPPAEPPAPQPDQEPVPEPVQDPPPPPPQES